MGRDRAAYMREYRARKRQEVITSMMPMMMNDYQRIIDLEAEVARLKRELATRATPAEWSPEGMTMRSMDAHRDHFNTRPFTPVPKK